MIQGHLRFLLILGLAGAVLLGCSSTATLPGSDSVSTDFGAAPAHTLVYIIHGDGGYLYHEDGAARQADRKALAEARLVAEHAPHTDVFIFHQRPRRNLFGLFPRPDGTFYHYRNGELLAETRYQRDPSGTGLSREAELYDANRHPDTPGHSLLYYGHEIEEGDGSNYHGSHSAHPFGLDELVGGLKQFGADEAPFDLVVLSTCNNGTPGSVAALAPLTRYVLASPGNLHLSYIDSHPLHRAGTTETGMEKLAPALAEWAYERLARRTETAVTITLYDTEELAAFLPDLQQAYEALRAEVSSRTAYAMSGFIDCRNERLPELEEGAPGVQQWYRPPAFGPGSKNNSHSGWGCPPSSNPAN